MASFGLLGASLPLSVSLLLSEFGLTPAPTWWRSMAVRSAGARRFSFVGDQVLLVGAPMLLVAAALLACAVPAWRAVRIDPASTLRAE